MVVSVVVIIIITIVSYQQPSEVRKMLGPSRERSGEGGGRDLQIDRLERSLRRLLQSSHAPATQRKEKKEDLACFRVSTECERELERVIVAAGETDGSARHERRH